MLLHSPGLALHHMFDGRKKPLMLNELKKKKAEEEV